MRSLPLGTLLCTTLAFGCAADSDQPALRMRRTELYFGQETNLGGHISADQWAAFVDREVTPRFPAGVTILGAAGQWTDPRGALVREESRVVILLHRPSREAESRIESIRSTYVKQFSQDAVMRVDSPAIVRF